MRKWVWCLFLVGLLLSSCASANSETDSGLPTQTMTPNLTSASNTGFSSDGTVVEILRRGEIYRVALDKNPDEITLVGPARLEWSGDFDGDAETEFLVSAYQRAAMGITVIFVLDYDEAIGQYRTLDSTVFRASCFDGCVDLENDGVPEIMAKDEDFHYASGGAGADSAYSPIMILRYKGREFSEVTQQYPDLIAQDAEDWLQAIDDAAGEPGLYLSMYASYLADMHLLGRWEEGVGVFSQLCAERLTPYFTTQRPNSTWACDDFVQRIQEALPELGYD